MLPSEHTETWLGKALDKHFLASGCHAKVLVISTKLHKASSGLQSCWYDLLTSNDAMNGLGMPSTTGGPPNPGAAQQASAQAGALGLTRGMLLLPRALGVS